MIHVNLYAALRRYLPDEYRRAGSIVFEAAEDGKVVDVIRQLGIHPDEVSEIRVNGVRREFEQPLDQGDRLELFPAGENH